MINIGIIEDDNLMAQNLKKLINDWGTKNEKYFLIDTYATADKFLSQKRFYDIVFFDIELPGTDGITAAKRLREYDEDVIIIFVTSISTLVIDSILSATGFLIPRLNIRISK